MISLEKLVRGAILPVCGAIVAVGCHPAVQAYGVEPVQQAAPAATSASNTAKAIDKATADGFIFERQQIMMQLDDDAEELGMIVAGLSPRTKLAATARAIANGAKEAEASFKAHVEGGQAKPEIWTNWADYNQLMQTFVTKTENMAKLAEAGDFNGVVETLGDAMPCKACHTTYRAPKKPV